MNLNQSQIVSKKALFSSFLLFETCDPTPSLNIFLYQTLINFSENKMILIYLKYLKLAIPDK